MKIHIYFAGHGSVPYDAFTQVIERVHGIVLDIERRELAEIASLVGGVPEKVIDQAQEEFEAPGVASKLFRVEAAKPGSLEIVISVTALVLWVLQNTIGEVVTEAWKETDLRKRIKETLLRRLGMKAEAIKEEINHGNRKAYSDARKSLEAAFIEVEMFARSDAKTGDLWIRVNPLPEDEDGGPELPPTWDEVAGES